MCNFNRPIYLKLIELITINTKVFDIIVYSDFVHYIQLCND